MSRSIVRVLLVFVASVGWALSPGASAADSLPVQSSSNAGVTIKIAAKSLSGDTWDFEVLIDTHSQDLSDDLLRNTVLVADGGTPATPTGWQGDPPGGHHRRGVLRFSAVTPRPGAVELRLQRPGESGPRVFRWILR